MEAPETTLEMGEITKATARPDLANMVEQGATPVLAPGELDALGFKIAAYPLTLLLAATRAMEETLEALKAGQSPDNLATFQHLREVAGFDDYFAAEKKYADK